MEWAQYERMRSATLPFGVDCVPPALLQQPAYISAPPPKKFKANAATIRTSHGEITWDQLLDRVGPKAADTVVTEEPASSEEAETAVVVAEPTDEFAEIVGAVDAPPWLAAALNSGRRQPALEAQALYERLRAGTSVAATDGRRVRHANGGSTTPVATEAAPPVPIAPVAAKPVSGAPVVARRSAVKRKNSIEAITGLQLFRWIEDPGVTEGVRGQRFVDNALLLLDLLTNEVSQNSQPLLSAFEDQLEVSDENARISFRTLFADPAVGKWLKDEVNDTAVCVLYKIPEGDDEEEDALWVTGMLMEPATTEGPSQTFPRWSIAEWDANELKSAIEATPGGELTKHPDLRAPLTDLT